MSIPPTSRFARALTLMEVLGALVAVLVLVALALTFLTKERGRSRSQCQNNLAYVGLAFRVWANDNDDKYPYATTNCLAFTNETQAWLHYLTLSNELGSARILTCPQDSNRLAHTVNYFTPGPGGLLGKSNLAVSYFVGLDADETLPITLLTGDRNLLSAGSSTNPFVLLLATNTPFRWESSQHANFGNITLSDGSVQRMDRRALHAQLVTTGIPPTNRLLMPVVPP
jgi:hypothetical protein